FKILLLPQTRVAEAYIELEIYGKAFGKQVTYKRRFTHEFEGGTSTAFVPLAGAFAPGTAYPAGLLIEPASVMGSGNVYDVLAVDSQPHLNLSDDNFPSVASFNTASDATLAWVKTLLPEEGEGGVV